MVLITECCCNFLYRVWLMDRDRREESKTNRLWVTSSWFVQVHRNGRRGRVECLGFFFFLFLFFFVVSGQKKLKRKRSFLLLIISSERLVRRVAKFRRADGRQQSASTGIVLEFSCSRNFSRNCQSRPKVLFSIFFGSAVHERNENVFFSFSASLFGCRLTFPTEWNVFFLWFFCRTVHRFSSFFLALKHVHDMVIFIYYGNLINGHSWTLLAKKMIFFLIGFS